MSPFRLPTICSLYRPSAHDSDCSLYTEYVTNICEEENIVHTAKPALSSSNAGGPPKENRPRKHSNDPKIAAQKLNITEIGIKIIGEDFMKKETDPAFLPFPFTHLALLKKSPLFRRLFGILQRHWRRRREFYLINICKALLPLGIQLHRELGVVLCI